MQQQNKPTNLILGKGLNRYFSKDDTQIGNKHIKRWSTPLIIQEMQSKPQWHTNLYLLGWLLLKTKTNPPPLHTHTKKVTSVDKDVEKLEPVCIAGGWECQMVQLLWKSLVVPRELKHRIIICSTNSSTGYIPKRIESRDSNIFVHL